MKTDYTYICEKGHVDLKPSMGTYETCQFPVPVEWRGRLDVAKAPCGCPVVQVPFDPVLEATFKIGGPEAVLSVIRERITNGPARSRGTRGVI